MTDEKYMREIAEMRTHLDLLMEFLRRSDEDHKCGWIMRKKLKWHGLQMKREHRLNAQKEEEESPRDDLGLGTSTTLFSEIKEVCCSSQGGSG